MAKGTLKDRVLDDARNKALRMSYTPEAIMKSYKVGIKSGYLVLNKRTSEKKPSKS